MSKTQHTAQPRLRRAALARWSKQQEACRTKAEANQWVWAAAQAVAKRRAGAVVVDEAVVEWRMSWSMWGACDEGECWCDVCMSEY